MLARMHVGDSPAHCLNKVVRFLQALGTLFMPYHRMYAPPDGALRGTGKLTSAAFEQVMSPKLYLMGR
jgi:hypothetical protein